MDRARPLTPARRASRRAAHRAVLASHSGPQAEMFDRREAAALTGAAIGLQGQATRAEIRRVARRSSRLVLYYDRLWEDNDTWEPFAIAGREHLDAALARGRGVIFVPSHFGRYRWVPLALLELRLPVTLLVDERNHGLITADVDARIDAMHHHLRPDIFDTVESGDPSALWQLARALKGGSVTVMFADGNSGIDGQASPRGAQVVPFLGQSIFVRPGIGALAATTDATVVPVFCHERRDGPPILRFDPPIYRGPDERRSVYRERVMLELFATLEREVLAQPWLWEEWWILPRWLAAAPVFPEISAPPPRRFSVTLPGLVGRRLCLPRDDIWALRGASGPEIWSFASGEVVRGEAELADLLRAAEERRPAGAWLRERPSIEPARRTLEGALDAGLVALLR